MNGISQLYISRTSWPWRCFGKSISNDYCCHPIRCVVIHESLFLFWFSRGLSVNQFCNNIWVQNSSYIIKQKVEPLSWSNGSLRLVPEQVCITEKCLLFKAYCIMSTPNLWPFFMKRQRWKLVINNKLLHFT